MRVLSLFSGIGGLDAGFEKAGFNIVWANDFDKDACETHVLVFLMQSSKDLMKVWHNEYIY